MSMSRFPQPVKHPRVSYPGKPPRALPTMGGFEQMPVSKPQGKGIPQAPRRGINHYSASMGNQIGHLKPEKTMRKPAKQAFSGVKRAKTRPLDRDASGVK